MKLIATIDLDDECNNFLNSAFNDTEFQLQAESYSEAKKVLSNQPDIVMFPFSLNAKFYFLELHQQIQEYSPETKLIALVDADSSLTYERAFSNGADEVLRTPLIKPELLRRIQNLAIPAASSKVSESASNRPETSNTCTLKSARIIGESSEIKHLHNTISRASKFNWNVLVLGNSGVGKELVAREIHNNSDRKNQPFIALNCAGLNENLLNSQLFGHEKGAFTGADKQVKGVFELADNGTLFLDEIGDLPMSMQGALLRVLQEHTVTKVGGHTPIRINTRIVLATHKSLEQMVAQGTFREDLYHRINSLIVNVPKLKERKSDIPILLKTFLKTLSEEIHEPTKQLSLDAVNWLILQEWPGNVRQLQQVAKKLVLLHHSQIELEDVIAAYGGQYPHPEYPCQKPNLKLVKSQGEQESIKIALAQSNGNKTEAARMLGIGRATLYRKIKEYDLAKIAHG